MITSTLDNLHWYKSISPAFATAIDYALSADFASMAPGRYDLAGDTVFAIVNEYTTKPASECDPEAHRIYADIQLMIAGRENFGYTPLLGQAASVPYSEEKDVAIFAPPADAVSYITLSPGEFIIFFPTDVHQPEVFVGQPAAVKKVVLKIAVNG